jgi:hypothetical protein
MLVRSLCSEWRAYRTANDKVVVWVIAR